MNSQMHFGEMQINGVFIRKYFETLFLSWSRGKFFVQGAFLDLDRARAPIHTILNFVFFVVLRGF